ncbi:hypothetical protein H310_10134 [Aphanomyces invadans]|uniref:Amino acid transporter transmembrane domain-containing protein n=1 Tax=Aphanomyces invadans TaxID=157072 RepID=A0A024TS64_9STRA|nr:hypothetical protein H310_10134 [Aphanomyces invadans]ETV96849.1 hypothetical protein H310_10134 [Aphanomyces invadans]|eukprot:XP_008874626.1 hypothetical protein H310_10134 [Aphanomyces invadans]
MELRAPLLLPTSQPLRHGEDDMKAHLQRDGEQRKNTWIDSMFIVVANVVGIGVLGLAHAFSKLGWIWGALLLVSTLAGSLYSGILMTRMKCHVPHAVVFADLGYEAYGNLGKAFVTLFGYTYIIGTCFSFQLTASLFLQEMINGLCFVYCALMVAALVLPLAQYRSFTEMNSIAVVGAVSMIVPILVILVEIAWRGNVQPTTTSWVSNATFDAAVVACMDVVFAMSGHVFFVEIMSEMRDPREFSKSIVAATSFFTVVYIPMAVVGYYFVGEVVTNPITNNMANLTMRRWCSIFILCHIVVAYVMAVMVLARAVEQRVLHRSHEKSKHASVANRTAWLGITGSIVCTSFLVSNVVPFINDLLGFVGAISGVTTTYVFPFLLAPVILRDEMTRGHARVLHGVAVASTVVAIVGVISSVHRMANSYETKAPFSC